MSAQPVPGTKPLFIPVILGTPRQGRYSEHVAKFVTAELAKFPGVETKLVDVRDLPLPVTDAGEDIKDKAFSELCMRADGFVIVAPEYNHGYPGLLKHALDTNLKEYIHKAVGICGVSAGGFGGTRVSLEPAVDLVAEALGRVACVAVEVPHLVHVVLRRLVGVVSKIAFAAARILAAEDAVVVAAVHPVHQLLDAPYRVGMRSAPLGDDAQEAVPARVPLFVLGRLAQEDVEVEAAGRHAGGHHHEQAGGDERIAAGECAGAVGGQLRRTGPLEQHREHSAVREPDQEGEDALELEEDRERRRVQHVIRQHVSELMPEQRPELVRVEHLDKLG